MGSYHPHAATWKQAIELSQELQQPDEPKPKPRRRRLKKPDVRFVFCRRCRANFKADPSRPGGLHYCSEEHHLEDQRDAKAKGRKLCEQCAAEFQARTSRQKYCGDDCRNEAKVDRQRARRSKAKPEKQPRGWMTREQMAGHLGVCARTVSRMIRTGGVEKRSRVEDGRRLYEYRQLETPPPTPPTQAQPVPAPAPTQAQPVPAPAPTQAQTGVQGRWLLCKVCGLEFQQTGVGRSRHYCGAACYEKGRWQRTKEKRPAYKPRGPRKAVYAEGPATKTTTRTAPAGKVENLVTAERVAAYLAMTPEEVDELTAAGVLPAIQLGTHRRYKLSHVIKACETQLDA
jgi:hypothetical protein